jgi:hypothetical protein
MCCVKSPFTLFVIPDLIRNPVFSTKLPLEFIPYCQWVQLFITDKPYKNMLKIWNVKTAPGPAS